MATLTGAQAVATG